MKKLGSNQHPIKLYIYDCSFVEFVMPWALLLSNVYDVTIIIKDDCKVALIQLRIVLFASGEKNLYNTFVKEMKLKNNWIDAHTKADFYNINMCFLTPYAD